MVAIVRAVTASTTLAEGRLPDWAITLVAVCLGLAAGVWLWRARSGG